MVELAVIRPLMAIEKALTAQERRELDDAARVATERLRSLRDEWRAAHGIVRGPLARRGGRERQPDGLTHSAASVARAVECEMLKPDTEAQTLQADASATTAADHPTLSGPRPAASAGAMPAPSKARKTRRAADLEPNSGFSISARGAVATGSTTHAIPPPRAAGSGAVEARRARAIAPPIVVDEAASGPPRPAVPVQAGPASSCREGEGKPSLGSRKGGSGDVVARVRSGSAATAVPPHRTVPQEVRPLPAISACAAVEPPVSVDCSVVSGNRKGSTDSFDRRDSPSPEPGAEVRRHLVAQYALVLAACRAWSDDRKRRLAALARIDPQDMWGLMLDECHRSFGHRNPVSIDGAEISKRLDAVLRHAEIVGFTALPELRNAFLREKQRVRRGHGGRDDSGGLSGN